MFPRWIDSSVEIPLSSHLLSSIRTARSYLCYVCIIIIAISRSICHRETSINLVNRSRNDFSPHNGPNALLRGLDPLSIAYVLQVLQNSGNKSIAALYRLFKSIYVTSRSCTPDAHRIPPVQHEHASESRRGRSLPTFVFLFLAHCSNEPSFCPSIFNNFLN